MPAVSIIVPIYNVEDYLDECLSSIVNQTLNDIEIICVNDGSTDNSLEIIQKFASADDRVKVIDKKNAGYGAAMNDGISAAEGEYIGIVEPDDFVDTDMYESLYDIATKRENEYDLVKSAWREISDDDSYPIVKDPYKDLPQEKPINLSSHMDALTPHPSIWTGIYKTSLIRDNQIKFKEVPGAGWVDNPFFLETLFFAEKPAFTSRPFYNYRAGNEVAHSSLRDATIPFSRLLEMLDFLDSQEEREVFRKALLWRAFPYLRSTLNSPAYEKQADQANELIRRFFSRVPSEMIDDPIFNLEDRENFELFSKLELSVPESKNPRVTIVVPCKNCAGVINRCVDSLKSQTLQDMEVFFIDFGSSDYTPAKLYARTLDDGRMKVIRLVENTEGAAKRLGLDNASGEYVAFMQPDETADPGFASCIYSNAIESHADILFYNSNIYLEKSGKFKDDPSLNIDLFGSDAPSAPSGLKPFLSFTVMNTIGHNALFKTEFTRNNDLSFLDIPAFNDVSIFVLSFLLAKNVAIDDQCHLHRKQSLVSLESKEEKRFWKFLDQGLQGLKKSLDHHEVYLDHEREFKNFAAGYFAKSADALHSSRDLASFFETLKMEWLPKYELPIERAFYRNDEVFEFIERIYGESVEELLMDELQLEISKRKQALREKREAVKELKDIKKNFSSNASKNISNNKKAQKTSNSGKRRFGFLKK